MGQRLGQHFLKNKTVLKEAAEILEIKKGDLVVEIGPGHGELTNFLLSAGAKITVIEKDEKLAQGLKEKFEKKIKVITGDALIELPKISKNKEFKDGNYKIAGNIPYYITGYLMRTIGELKNKPEAVTLIIQKEVAKRICAQKGEMNLLAASIQIWAKPKLIRIVPSGDFSPKPKVDSAIIKLTTGSLKPAAKNIGKYYKTIKIIFKQPRKTILNNLAEGVGGKEKAEIVLVKAGINPALRPQNLSVEDLAKISDHL